MSSLVSSQKFQFSWQPCKRVLVTQYMVFCLALIAILISGTHWLVQCFAVLVAIVYATISLQNYWRQPSVEFFSSGAKLFCRQNFVKAIEIQHIQWQDWGYILVLQAKLAGQNKQWLWSQYQLNEMENRNLRLMIRSHLKKECASMPSITSNPVL